MLAHLFSIEHSTAELASRLWKHFGYVRLLVGASLVIGTLGFHAIAIESWSDAFLNSAMLLSGMGPVGDIDRATVAGKIFAALFSLYSGLVFLAIAGILFTPVLHEVLHTVRMRLDRIEALRHSSPIS
jgi:hypothetical protein